MKRLDIDTSEPAKCLVIQNYRHAFDLTGRDTNVRRFNTYEFIKDAFGDRAANVLLNTRILQFVPMAGGLWEAAFAAAGYPRIGFDLAESPFGEDPFDDFPVLPKIRNQLNYSDVFTGFVYTHPISEQYFSNGIPGLYNGFEEEIIRRSELISAKQALMMRQIIKYESKVNIPRTRDHPAQLVETLLELIQLGVTGVGLVIALIAVLMRRGIVVNKFKTSTSSRLIRHGGQARLINVNVKK